jgi:RNA polymerase sigma factor (sigma-70 family)
VLQFFVRVTGRADVAADLCAETFAAALDSQPDYRSERGSAGGWLFGIARHKLADSRSRGCVEDRARRRLGMEPIALPDPALERIDQLRGGETLELLRTLPDDQRQAIEGRIVSELDYEEIAASLECSPSVVRQRVSRGLRSLRKQLHPTGRECPQ